MNKPILLKLLCIASLLCAAAFAEESDKEEQEHALLGNRIVFERQENEGQREADGQKAQSEPSPEMLAACKECLNDNSKDALFCQEKMDVKKKSAYVATHPNALHYPIAVTLPFGDPIQLEEGSIWGIHPNDSYKTLNWRTTDSILILPNRNFFWNGTYPYCLLNQQTGEKARAYISAASWVGSGYSRWIYSIDYYNCQLVLNDGSIWNVPFCDSWVLSSFLPGDYVIMGFNDRPGNGLGSNILINFNTLQHVYSTCIFY